MRKDLNSIKKDFEGRIEELKSKIEAWEKVERLSKKNGEDFAVLSKNFNNADVCNKEYSIKSHDKELRVWCKDAKGRFINDSIDLYQLVKYTKFEVEEERIIKESYIEPYFLLTIDEVFIMINKTIEQYKKQVVSYEKQLEKLEKNYNDVMGKIEDIKEILSNIINENEEDFTSTRYALIDVIKNHWYY